MPPGECWKARGLAGSIAYLFGLFGSLASATGTYGSESLAIDFPFLLLCGSCFPLIFSLMVIFIAFPCRESS